MNPLFKGITPNIAKDLVNFIIMTIHSELNKVKETEVNDNEENCQMDQINKKIILDYYFIDFKNKNQSIISNLFYATNCSISECYN